MNTEISYTKKSVARYASKISSAWHKAAESIIDVGKMLNEAADELGSDFRHLIRGLHDGGVMSKSTISKLRGIANNKVLIAEERISMLPRSYETLYNLSKWDDDELQRGFDEGFITPQLEQRDSKWKSAEANTKPKSNILFTVSLDSEKLSKISESKIADVVGVLEAIDGITVKMKQEP